MPVFRLSDDHLFPPPHMAEEGLLAVGGDLTPERLIAAYRCGVFPWYGEGDPILWWSPDPRMVLLPQEIHVARRLRRTLRQGKFQVTADTAFDEVIAQCAAMPRPGQAGTWILPEMIRAYTQLHQRGYAHSVECWHENTLVGGLYGVSVGGAFFAESMYSKERDASKAALVALARYCRRNRYVFIDCQMPTDHLARMGARPLSRPTFLRMLQHAIAQPGVRAPWRMDNRLFSEQIEI